MKNLLFTILFLFVTIFCQSQNQPDPRDGRHIFNYRITLTQCEEDGTSVSGSPEITTVKRDWIFTIENILANHYIINIAKFTSKSSSSLNLKTYEDSTGKIIYYKLSKTDYDLNAERLLKNGSFIVGASTTLIKIRPGNDRDENDRIYSEFGNDFNLGFTAGWKISKFRNRDVSLAFVGGLSYSAIKVTPQTTRDFITTESTQSAITVSFGVVVEIEKFQISGFLGLDHLSGEIGENWIYRGRPWIGLGFGYEILKARGKTKND